MIHQYAMSLQGADHEKSNTVCQDAHKVIKCNETLVIAAVADGLGSSEYSDAASRIAVDTATQHCADHSDTLLSGNVDEIFRVIKASFWEAQGKIENEAETQDHDIDQYHTTLSLVVMFNDTLYYGHAGDSGIIALTTEGLFEKVTEQRRDEDGNVFPLFFEKQWDFGLFDNKVCSVLLATDGLLFHLLPNLLKDKPVNINVNRAGVFMDNRSLDFDKNGENAVKTRVEDYIRNLPSTEFCGDDLTIAVLVNTAIVPGTQPDDYYKEPDWQRLRHKQERIFYPHIFPDTPCEAANTLVVEPEKAIDNDTIKAGEADIPSNDPLSDCVKSEEEIQNSGSDDEKFKTKPKKECVPKNPRRSKPQKIYFQRLQNLENDINALVCRYFQTHQKRMPAKAVLEALVQEKGYENDDKLPSERTVRKHVTKIINNSDDMQPDANTNS